MALSCLQTGPTHSAHRKVPRFPGHPEADGRVLPTAPHCLAYSQKPHVDLGPLMHCSLALGFFSILAPEQWGKRHPVTPRCLRAGPQHPGWGVGSLTSWVVAQRHHCHWPGSAQTGRQSRGVPSSPAAGQCPLGGSPWCLKDRWSGSDTSATSGVLHTAVVPQRRSPRKGALCWVIGEHLPMGKEGHKVPGAAL